MCTSVAQCWLKYYNILFAVLSLALTGWGIYLSATTKSPLGYTILGLSIYLMLTSALGFLAARKGHPWLLTAYNVMAMLFLIFELVFSLALLTAQDKTLSLLQDMSENSSASNFIKNNAAVVHIIVLGLLGLQLVTVLLACCCADRIREKERGTADSPDLTERLVAHQNASDLEYGTTAPSATPKTDAHRDAMREKYGDRISASGSARQKKSAVELRGDTATRSSTSRKGFSSD